jgi:hypothetical protein
LAAVAVKAEELRQLDVQVLAMSADNRFSHKLSTGDSCEEARSGFGDEGNLGHDTLERLQDFDVTAEVCLCHLGHEGKNPPGNSLPGDS